jgi:hypothetical protein
LAFASIPSGQARHSTMELRRNDSARIFRHFTGNAGGAGKGIARGEARIKAERRRIKARMDNWRVRDLKNTAPFQ